MIRNTLSYPLLILGLAACSSEIPNISTNQPPKLTFEQFEAQTYQEPDTGVYLVNGDETAESLEDLFEFYLRVEGSQNGSLIVHQSGGNDACWTQSERQSLSYCVSTKSFGANYNKMVAAMDSATAAWEEFSNVNFVHDASQDGNCTNRNQRVLFDVNQTNNSGYLARAFFPGYSRRNSNILVSTSIYPYDDDASDPLTLVGVMRHELGHALGFRHEHTRPEAGTCYEDSNWRALTAYDSASVMHYPQCNGTNGWDLPLTDKDTAGAADLYGAQGSSTAGSCSAIDCVPSQEICDDGIDNDCDGRTDGADADCDSGSQCLPAGSSCKNAKQCCASCIGPRKNRTCD